jgi:hypothetical protein
MNIQVLIDTTPDGRLGGPWGCGKVWAERLQGKRSLPRSRSLGSQLLQTLGRPLEMSLSSCRPYVVAHGSILASGRPFECCVTGRLL